MKKDVKAEITAQLVELITTAQEDGSDWTMPFRSLYCSPHNAVTGKKYRGMNAFWLGLMGQHTVAGMDKIRAQFREVLVCLSKSNREVHFWQLR